MPRRISVYIVELETLDESTVQERCIKWVHTLPTVSQQSITEGRASEDMRDIRTLSQPKTVQFPGPSILRMASVAVLDHGSFAPTSAQPIPSRMRYLVCVLISSGTSFSSIDLTQLQILPVVPWGSLGGA